MVHCVFSVDASPYQRWQADLLAYSHRRVAQPGPITRLLSGDGRPTAFAHTTFRAVPYSPHPVSGDDYAPYNKPSALLAWLRSAPPVDETVLLLDPDCVFVAPLDIEASRDEPIGQPLSYMHPDATVVARHCRRPGSVRGIGIPIVIHRDDLSALAASWLEKTEAIRNDRLSRDLVGWVAEMWGYVFAAAELGLRHRRRALARFTTDDRTDLPLIHYCYTSIDDTGGWSWDKRSYRPWRRVDDPSSSTPRAAATVVAMVNECAAAQGYRTLRASAPRRLPRGC
jgi:peptidyl serine alpha-galactosyltransferase